LTEIFDRYEEQCAQCASYIGNTAEEVRKLMNACEMECVFDKYCHNDCPCDAFTPVPPR